MAAIIDGTSGITSPTYNGTVTAEYSVPVTAFKNRIINGAMVIDQRNAGAAVTPSSGGTYSVDRWRLYATQSSKFTVQQNYGSVTPPAGFVNYLGYYVASAYTPSVATDEFFHNQKIEGYNIADLNWGTANAKTVTLSFWVRSSLTGTFAGFIRNEAGDRNYIFTYTISSANTWEQKTVTITGCTDGTWQTTTLTGIGIGFSLGANAALLTSSTGTWISGTSYSGASTQVNLVTTAGATWYITGVQLEKGSTATSFDYRPYGTELALCQRYLPAISTTVLNGAFSNFGSAYSTTHVQAAIAYPVTSRVSPTGISLTGSLSVGDGVSSLAVSSLAFGGASPYACFIDGTVTGATQYRPYKLSNNNNASAYIELSAEL